MYSIHNTNNKLNSRHLFEFGANIRRGRGRESERMGMSEIQSVSLLTHDKAFSVYSLNWNGAVVGGGWCY